jgi:hypothetical protein
MEILLQSTKMLNNLFFFERQEVLTLTAFQKSLTNQNLFHTIIICIPCFLSGKRLVVHFLLFKGNRRRLGHYSRFYYIYRATLAAVGKRQVEIKDG